MTDVIGPSKLVAFEFLNFMSIGSARLEFDESGILNITGYNDSGKSALTRAIEVLFYNAYSTEQVNYIQDGCEFFGVGAEFDDGISINKYKYRDGKSVWEMLKDDEVIFTNRLADGVAAMGDIPDVIAKYLMVVKDDYTDEKLNVRRNTDRLFLINTTGGDNYKILNSVLRADVLAESIKRMNEDRNKLQSEVTSKVTSVKTLRNELENITVVDDETLQRISDGVEKLSDSKLRLEYLTAINNQKQIYDEIQLYDEIPLVDTSRLREIEQLQSLKQATETVIYEECRLVDTSRLHELERIMELRKELDMVIPPEVPLVDVERYGAMKNIGMLYNELYQVTTDLTNTEAERTQVTTQLAELSAQHGFKICKNCGTVAV